jgi:hypothetical protein
MFYRKKKAVSTVFHEFGDVFFPTPTPAYRQAGANDEN